MGQKAAAAKVKLAVANSMREDVEAVAEQIQS